MKKIENYRPPVIEFTTKTSEVPVTLGKFKSDDEARLFMAENLLAMQTKLVVSRKLDEYEKEQLRKEYTLELEDVLPTYREAYLDAVNQLERAKKLEKDAKEMVNASLNKIQNLADEVNDGITEMELDQAHTWEVVHNGKRLYYTYIDGEIKLCKLNLISPDEIDDLITTSEKNANFFKGKLKANKVG